MGHVSGCNAVCVPAADCAACCPPCCPLCPQACSTASGGLGWRKVQMTPSRTQSGRSRCATASSRRGTGRARAGACVAPPACPRACASAWDSQASIGPSYDAVGHRALNDLHARTGWKTRAGAQSATFCAAVRLSSTACRMTSLDSARRNKERATGCAAVPLSSTACRMTPLTGRPST